MIGSGSYETAFYMCHRLRAGMFDPDFRQLMGIVEVDETFIGGKEKNKHRSKRIGPHTKGTTGKTPVIGAISRKGNVVCQVIENTDLKTLDSFVRKMVSDKVDLVATDEHPSYGMLKKGYLMSLLRTVKASTCAARFILRASIRSGRYSSAELSAPTTT